MKWNMISTGDIALRKGGSVDPKKHQDEVFELYSIPAFDAGAPEVVAGSAIGSSKKAVQPNDVMISRIVPHIRRACVVGPAKGHRQIASGEWIIFRDERIWPKYLRWQLVGDVFHSAFMRTVSGVGGSLLRARPAEVFKIQIPLPPLAEQKRIARILDVADALRAKRREAIVQLDTLLRSTFLDMFGDPVTNPMGWETYALGEVGEVITGNTPSRKRPEYYGDDIEWIKSDNINDPSFVLTEAVERLSVTGRAVARTIPRGSILVTCIAGSPSCIGNAAIADREVAFNQQINAFVPGERIALWFAFRVFWVGKRLVQSASTSSMKGMVSKSAFSAISIPIPPTSLQSRFAAIVESAEHQKASQRAHLAELDTLFASLQSRAFRGRPLSRYGSL